VKKPSAKVIVKTQSSVSKHIMVTFEVEFPRPILAEVNTHNALNKNTSSSRAIPVENMIKQVKENTAYLSRYGAANKGMQDAGPHDGLINIFNYVAGEWHNGGYTAEEAWKIAADSAVMMAEAFNDAGYAKQVCNRLLEPFQWVKMVISCTDINNFFWLRDHHMADPTIQELARAMKDAYNAAETIVLNPGEWHVPYYNDGVWKATDKKTFMTINRPKYPVDKFGYCLDDALAISASCCAQASYRTLDDTIEKARKVIQNLNLGVDLAEPCHASPTEHQGTPIAESFVDGPKAINYMPLPSSWQAGITHVMRDGTFGSGNLKGYIQHRQLIPGNVKEG
jgi:hypothetical protein